MNKEINFLIKEILSKRITVEKKYCEVPKNIIRKIILDNFVLCDNKDRIISMTVNGMEEFYIDKNDKMITLRTRYDNVYELITEMCEDYGLKLILEIENEKIIFDVVEQSMPGTKDFKKEVNKINDFFKK